MHRFLRAAHRRLVAVRTIERIGLCVLVGCLFAGALMPVLIWRGQSALGVALVMIGLGLFGGAVWGIAHRPSRLRTAMEADRQLDLDDLLATAWTVVTRAQDDAWATSVVAIAEARCATLSPGELILSRYGARAWSGIGLAAAVVLGVGVLSSQPLVLRAGPSDASLLGADRANDRSAKRPAAPLRPAEASARGAGGDRSQPGAASPQRRAPGSDQPVEPATDPTAASAESSSAAAPSPSNGTTGTGPGEGRSTRTTDATPHEPIRSAAAPTDPAAANAVLDRSTGGAGAPGDGDDPAASGSTVASPERASPPAAPWQSPTWPQDRAAAIEAVENGAVPDAYRDLVRDYFDAPGGASR